MSYYLSYYWFFITCQYCWGYFACADNLSFYCLLLVSPSSKRFRLNYHTRALSSIADFRESKSICAVDVKNHRIHLHLDGNFHCFASFAGQNRSQSFDHLYHLIQVVEQRISKICLLPLINWLIYFVI